MNSLQHLKIIRIGLIITIIAGFAVGALNGLKVRETIRHLQSNLRDQTVARQKAEMELAGARQELETTVAALSQATTKLQAVTVERESALASAAGHKKRAEQLARDLASSRREADDARAELARYKAAGMDPAQIIRATELIRKLQNELGFVEAKNKVLREQVKNLADRREGNVVKLPASLDGKVLTFDPRWQFVVLDAGEEQGVLEGGELLVNRGGKLVAKVVVTRVEEDRCVATVIPGWGFGEIAEGDRAIPAHPGS